MMLGQDRAQELVSRAVEVTRDGGADYIVALYSGKDEGLTRYCNDAVQMSTEYSQPTLYLQAGYGNRLGAAGTNVFDEISLSRLAGQTRILAAGSTDRTHMPRLAPPVRTMPGVESWHPETAGMSPGERADIIARAVHEGEEGEVRMFGHLVSGAEERAVANSEGLVAYHAGSVGRFQVSTIAPSGGMGFARFVGRSLDGVDPPGIARRALDKAALFDTFTDLVPGEYEAVLEPEATAEILFHLGYLGFGAAGHLNESSCLSGAVGEQVFPHFVSICDDPLRKDQMSEPFDPEGVPRRRVQLVERGTVRGVVHDLNTAAQAGTASTGHGRKPEGVWFTDGPYARNMVLEPATASRQELISRVNRGLLITRLHYTRPLDASSGVLTGMTRDGTFLIEDGVIAAMLPNLRFTVSAVDLLAHILDIGCDLTLATEYFHMNLVPSIRTRHFRVTGRTE